jgi:pilus assembly protein Flp/PilA
LTGDRARRPVIAERLQMLTFLVFFQNLLDRSLRRDDRGVTAVEYGLLVFFIALVIIAGVTLLGKNLDALFSNIAGQL